MRPFARTSRSARLGFEALEDRLTPAVAYTLSAVGLGTANLRSFDTATPSITTTTTITNITPNETLVGIDFRPQNGHLYGLGVNLTGTGTLYDISVRTGRASPIGAPGSVTTTDGLPNPATAGTAFAFDFNPVVDAIRVHVSDGDNFVIDPNTGTTLANQTALSTALGLSGAGYTNNAPNATNTTLYDIGAAADSLYIIPDPANGVATLVGALGVDFSVLNGFDIPAGVNAPAPNGTAVTTGSGFAALTVGGVARLYSVNLVTGAATLIGTIGGGTSSIGGLAIQNDYTGFPAIGISGTAPGAANLVRFNTATPGTTTTVAVTGLAATETLVGSAFRPQTGQLYGLGVNATGTGTLYLINPQTGAATVVGATGGITVAAALPNPATGGFGFAFNPTVDLIRVVTSAGQSFAVNPNTGAVASQAPTVNGATTTVDAAAYTNGFGQTTGVNGPTTLFVLDSATDRLLIQNAATSTTTAVASLTLNGAPLNFTAVNGFDIPAGVVVATSNAQVLGTAFGFATLVVGGTPGLYRINLKTGAATSLGTLGTTLTGLTLADAPGGVVSFQSGSFSGGEGGAGINVVLTRNSGSGPLAVTISMAGGSATAGSDFTPGPFILVFPDGATTSTLTLPFTADGLTEGTETLLFALTAVPGGAIGLVGATTLTIADTSVAAPLPPPFFSGAQVFGNLLVLTGAGVAGGTQAIPLPPGSVALFADINGDGKSDVILGLPTGVVVLDGQTGRFALLAADVTGDGVRDLLMFNPDGTTTLTNGRTGLVTRI